MLSDDDYNPYWDWEEDDPPCQLCRGTGEINALTNQSYFFVASYATCPHCDGTGVAQ